jgi:sulfite reductase alpha subunit-like flavoprotein
MAELEVIHGRTALILYGSETGNAQDVAEELGRLCERLRFQTQVAELNAVNLVCRDTSTMCKHRGV